jgi:membrane associated rhomboid family serine protease
MKGQFFPYKDENVAKSRPYVTYALIAINVAVFVWSLTDYEAIIGAYGFTPAEFAAATLLTSMFLHGGLDHIFGNMWFLHIFGDNVEDMFGKAKYTLFYLLSGLAASLAHYLTNLGSAIPAIGASGAISGVLGAYLAFFPHVRIRVASYYYHGTVPAYTMLLFWFGLQLLFGAASFLGGRGSGIAFFAHIGGFVFGYAVAAVYRKMKR